MKKKVLVISGTRAEFGIFQSVITTLKGSDSLLPVLLVTGMHTLVKFGETINNIKDVETIVDYVVKVSSKGNMLSWLSEEITGIQQYCLKHPVDCILVLGDRDEAFAGAIVGSHLGIPVAHVHGGDITGKCIVDNYIRNAITQLSSFHFAATKKSFDRIIKMRGKNNVFVVGAPGIDQLKTTPKMEKEDMAVKYKLSMQKPWQLVIFHSSPLDKDIQIREQIETVIRAMDKIEGEKIWIYPNSDTGSDLFIKYLEQNRDKNSMHLYKNLDRSDFINFLRHVDVMVGNSSSGIIESTYFHLPVVNIGRRQKGREKSTNIISVGYDADEIIKAIRTATSTKFREQSRNARQLYGDGSSAVKIVSLLEKLL